MRKVECRCRNLSLFFCQKISPPGGGYSHTLDIRVCAAEEGMVFKPFGLLKGMVIKPFGLVEGMVFKPFGLV